NIASRGYGSRPAPGRQVSSWIRLFKQPKAFPRHALPEFCDLVVPFSERGRRESRALDAPVDVPRAFAHGVELQVQPRHPGFPRAMVLRLIRALPGEAAFLAPVAGGNPPT